MDREREDGLYLDDLTDIEPKTGESGKKPRASDERKARNRVIVLVLLNAAAAIYLIAAGYGYFAKSANARLQADLSADTPQQTAEEAPGFEVRALPVFDVTKVNADLTPLLRGVKLPNGLSPDFYRLYATNEDVVGWIRVPGTCIDSPLMKGPTNTYYERLNFYGEYDRRGSVWIDYRNVFGPGKRDYLNNVTVVWGHHFSEHDLAFYEIENYLNVEYYKSHPIIETENLYGEFYRWKIFACMVTAVEEEDDNGKVFYYWNTYVSPEQMPGYIAEVSRRSWFWNPAVDVVATDKIICLSTCSYLLNKGGAYYEIRSVLYGRLVRDGESDTVDVSGAVQNPSPRMPQRYYDQKGIANPYLNTPVFGF